MLLLMILSIVLFVTVALIMFGMLMATGFTIQRVDPNVAGFLVFLIAAIVLAFS